MNNYEIKEYIKCRDDIEYFFYNYITIENPERHYTPSYNQNQNNFFHITNIKEKSYFDCGRQIGSTTAGLVKALHTAIFKDYQRIVYFSHKNDYSKILNSKLIFMIQNLPDFLKPAVKVYSQNVMEFENNSKILFTSNIIIIKGMSINLMVFDNYILDNDFFSYFLPIYPDTKIIVINSGSVNKIQKSWKQYKDTSFNYMLTPIHTEEEKENILKSLTKEEYYKEYMCIDG